MDAGKCERLLAVLLRVAGVILLTAFGAILLPTGWMAAIHRWLSLGDFPASSLVDYLTRSISALYAIKGGLYLLLSTDVRRYVTIIGYVAWSAIAFGPALIAIDVHAGLPLRWTLGEGPLILIVGIVLLGLSRRVATASRGTKKPGPP
jgi:hypothetical protein